MNNDGYLKDYVKQLKEAYKDSGLEFSIQEKIKNNVREESICVKKEGSQVGMLISGEQLKKCPELIDDYLKDVGHMALINGFTDKIYNYKDVKNDIKIHLIGDNENNRNMVKDHLYENNLDMIERYVISTKMPDGSYATMGIPEQALGFWHMTKEDIRKQALENMDREARIMNLGCFVCISSEDAYKGAGQMLNDNVMQKIAKGYESDKLIVIPSSVHEILCLPYVDGNIQELCDYVGEVNQDIVTPMDKLTDNLYIYDAKEKKLEAYDTSKIQDWRNKDNEGYDER